jgi:hypothetical protein
VRGGLSRIFLSVSRPPLNTRSLSQQPTSPPSLSAACLLDQTKRKQGSDSDDDRERSADDEDEDGDIIDYGVTGGGDSGGVGAKLMSRMQVNVGLALGKGLPSHLLHPPPRPFLLL